MKLVTLGTIIMGAIAIGGLVVLSYWSFHPHRTLEVQSITTDKTEYKAGDRMVLHVEFCKFTGAEALITRRFVDGVVFTTPAVRVNNPPGCRDIDVAISVPNIPAGEYELLNTFDYQVNPVKLISVEATTNKFSIIE